MKRLIILFWMFTFVAAAQTPDIAFSRIISNAASMTTNNFFVGPATNGNGLMLTRPMTNYDIWPIRLKSATIMLVSNTTSETQMLDTNNILGRTQGIQPQEMVAGARIHLKIWGHTTQSTGTAQYRAYIGATVVADTGALSIVSATALPFEVDVWITYHSTTTVSGYIVAHFPAIADKPSSSASITAVTTVVNSAQQQFKVTVTPSSNTSVWQTRGAYVEIE